MITTLTGSNDFMIDNELKNKLNSFQEMYGSMAIEQIDGSEVDVQPITESLTNLSFLSPNRMIILKRGSANKQFMDSLEKIFDNIPSTNEVIIVEPAIDKRTSYYKLLKKKTDFNTFEVLDFGQLARWVDDTVKALGGNIKNSDARHLVETAGLNQMKLFNEITKLISYQPEINRQTIDLLVEPISQSTIFQLLDVAFAGDNKRLLQIYDDQKLQKVEPQQIIALLTWQIHVLAIIKAAGNRSPSQIASESKINPFVINKSMGIAKKISKQELQLLTDKLLELDVKLKNKSIDADEALLQLLLSISN